MGWGSHWAAIPGPNVIGASDNYMREVAYVRAQDPREYWAVGDYSVECLMGWSYAQTLAMRWRAGRGWEIIPSDNCLGMDSNGNPTGSLLNAVGRSSPKDVWAVGACGATEENSQQPLIENFDGKAWKIDPVPP
jgi:hypothetical protein